MFLLWKYALEGVYKSVSFLVKLNMFSLVYGQSLTTVSMKYPEGKLIAGVISLRSFWQKLNFISGDKCYVNITLKWNHPKGNICACKHLKKNPKVFDQKINYISFCPQWKLMKTEFFSSQNKTTFRVSCKHFLNQNKEISPP